MNKIKNIIRVFHPSLMKNTPLHSTFLLSTEESNHLSVLRVNTLKDEIEIFNGKGVFIFKYFLNIYMKTQIGAKAKIINNNKKSMTLEVIDFPFEFSKLPINITLATCIPKSNERSDFLFEKW